MKKYNLYVCMPASKFYEKVKAEEFRISDGRINFYVNSKLVSSYVSQYTIIESIDKINEVKND